MGVAVGIGLGSSVQQFWIEVYRIKRIFANMKLCATTAAVIDEKIKVEMCFCLFLKST